ncbi:hypothetical protein VTN77DRAFT_3515 [Rasamsonia byssochlamydoides]|uniref:uncharacterized protein n=1 Tax=Rasamsonia byssochlamydoides TaxID=89139 RepID=UPI0037421E70
MCVLVVSITYACGDIFHHYEDHSDAVQPALRWCNPVRNREQPICPQEKWQPVSLKYDTLICPICEQYANVDCCRRRQRLSWNEWEDEVETHRPITFIYGCGHDLELCGRGLELRPMLRSAKGLEWGFYMNCKGKEYDCVWQQTDPRPECHHCEMYGRFAKVSCSKVDGVSNKQHENPNIDPNLDQKLRGEENKWDEEDGGLMTELEEEHNEEKSTDSNFNLDLSLGGEEDNADNETKNEDRNEIEEWEDETETENNTEDENGLWVLLSPTSLD